MKRSIARLAAKYLFILLSPVLILTVLGYVAVFTSRDYAREQLVQVAQRSLAGLEAAVDRLVAEARATAVAFGTAAPVLRSLRERMNPAEIDLEGLQELAIIRDIVNRSAHARAEVQSMYIYLEEPGQVLTTEFGVIPLEELPDGSWIEHYRTTSPDLLSWIVRRESTLLGEDGPSETVLSVFQRLFVVDSRDVRGAVVLNIREATLRKQIADGTIQAETRYIVLDQDEELVLSNIEDAGLVASVTDRLEERNFEISHGELVYTVNSRRSHKNGWHYISVAPNEEFFAPVSRMARASLTIVSVAVAVGLLLALVMARRSYRHIREVADVVERSREDRDLPSLQGHSTKGFGYLTYHVLRAFVERQFYRLQLSERSYREKTLELLALQSQMNPHFLFNTLEAVNWQILRETGKPGPANEMITSLADVLKYSLRSPSSFVTMREDIENARRYAEIQSLRYRRSYELRVDACEDCLSALTVPMTFQPLVENAIVHGMGGRDSGIIRITAMQRGDTIGIRVDDNGVGVGQVELERIRFELAEAAPDRHDHIGIANTARRLELAMETTIEPIIGRSDLGGFSVELSIPARFGGTKPDSAGLKLSGGEANA